MLKLFKILVYSCEECPDRKQWMDGCSEHYCSVKLEDVDKNIPDWCPLPDYIEDDNENTRIK